MVRQFNDIRVGDVSVVGGKGANLGEMVYAGINVPELLSGNAITNMNVSANMLRSKFYVSVIFFRSVYVIAVCLPGLEHQRIKPKPNQLQIRLKNRV